MNSLRGSGTEVTGIKSGRVRVTPATPAATESQKAKDGV